MSSHPQAPSPGDAAPAPLVTACRILRFRQAVPRKAPRTAPRRPLAVPARAWATLFWLLTVCLLFAGSAWFARIHTIRVMQASFDPYYAAFSLVEDHWREAPRPPWPPTAGSAELQAYFHEWPQVVALQQRRHPFGTWQRSGDALVPLAGPLAPAFRSWFKAAQSIPAGGKWFPRVEDEQPEPAGIRSIVLVGEDWLVLKRWAVGSVEAEQVLHRFFPPHPDFQIVMLRSANESATREPLQPWGAWPHLQMDVRRYHDRQGIGLGLPFLRGERNYLGYGVTNTFGDQERAWTIALVPSPPYRQALIRVYRLRFTLTFACCLLAGLGCFLLWWRRQLQLRASHHGIHLMAAHTHSLKTPLAVIKLRCDLIRMWDQIPDALQADLMELGEDVNRLSSTIENSLRLFKFHAGSTGAFKEPLSPEWLGSHVAEIQGLLAPNDVGYQVELCPEAVLATPDCLQLALQTVLENAHLHGGLPVSVITRDLGDRILLRIEDHGQGIPPETVLQVQRFRRPRPWHRASQEAASGLGLYLLARLAQEEGWGLHVRCVAGQGTSISLELHRPSATRA